MPAGWLYHPVLPIRAGRKLVEEEQQKHWLERTNLCNHTDAERMLHSTWCAEELKKAVELGYKIIKIYEIWQFKEEDLRVGLFADYVNTWLKI